MSHPIVFDVDDLCDLHDPYDTLCRIKEQVPDFKATMFAIPARCSKQLLSKYDKQRDWIRLGMHGWRHTLGECYSWNPREASDKIERGLALGLDDSFRAPKWLITPIIYAACAEYNMPVADHARYCIEHIEGVRVYRYNAPNTPFRAMHYHTWNTGGTGIELRQTEITNFLKRGGNTFQWVSEAATTTSLLAQACTVQPSLVSLPIGGNGAS